MLLDLPSECVLRVLKQLPVADVVFIGCCCSALRALVADDAFWRDLAEAKWGAAVHQLKPLADADAQQRRSSDDSVADAGRASEQGTAQSGETAAAAAGKSCASNSSWQRYCCKRMSLRTIKASPLCLLQEAYPDPWMHITCCVLCSRTSGSATIRACIRAFFAAYPSPSACLGACPRAMAGLLHPLGLTAARLAAVSAVAQGFLGTDWQEPSEFKGCGKFVTDSWRIFCTGEREAKGVEDAKLKQYLAWVGRQQQAASDQLGAQEAVAAAAAAAAAADVISSSRRHKRAKPSAKAGSSTATKHQQQQAHQGMDAPAKQQSTRAGAPQRLTRAQAKAVARRAAPAAAAATAVERGAKQAATKSAVCRSGNKQVRQRRTIT